MKYVATFLPWHPSFPLFGSSSSPINQQNSTYFLQQIFSGGVCLHWSYILVFIPKSGENLQVFFLFRCVPKHVLFSGLESIFPWRLSMGNNAREISSSKNNCEFYRQYPDLFHAEQCFLQICVIYFLQICVIYFLFFIFDFILNFIMLLYTD